jgi:hypothetical protein
MTPVSFKKYFVFKSPPASGSIFFLFSDDSLHPSNKQIINDVNRIFPVILIFNSSYRGQRMCVWYVANDMSIVRLQTNGTDVTFGEERVLLLRFMLRGVLFD